MIYMFKRNDELTYGRVIFLSNIYLFGQKLHNFVAH